MLTKKAQVSETIMWVIATLIIIVALIVFLYFSSVLGKGKEVATTDIKFNAEKNADRLDKKTFFAYELAEQKYKKIIDDWRTVQNEK